MERTTLIDSIVAEIRDKVISGELKEGQMLASQDNLAKEMGMSRASLREPLNHLRLMGLIKDEAESVARNINGKRRDEKCLRTRNLKGWSPGL